MPPHVLFVVADDQRPDAIRAVGTDDVITPTPNTGYEPECSAMTVERVADRLRAELREWQRPVGDPTIVGS